MCDVRIVIEREGEGKVSWKWIPFLGVLAKLSPYLSAFKRLALSATGHKV